MQNDSCWAPHGQVPPCEGVPSSADTDEFLWCALSEWFGGPNPSATGRIKDMEGEPDPRPNLHQ